MPSPDNTVISLPGQSIIDAVGNIWSIVNGQVDINGKPDPTTANVIELAYENGQLWQKNTDNLWWSKTSPADAWAPASGTTTNPIPNLLTSFDDETISPAFAGPLIDASGNSWTITNGHVALNGVIDPTTANVIQMAYSNGRIWQENSDGLWWSKAKPSDTWSPPQGAAIDPIQSRPPSPNDAVDTQEGLTGLVDASGNEWSIENGQVALNGTADPTTANVIELAYVNGQIWQENSNHLWWGKTVPSDPWSPTAGISASISAEASIVTLTDPNGVLTDASGTRWSIRNGQVAVNGTPDPTTANVIELAFYNGQIWQENSDHLWWGKAASSDPWSPPAGTTTRPVPNVERTWLGGLGPANYDTASDWSPYGAPESGDTAFVRGGSINLTPGDATGVNFILGGPLAPGGSVVTLNFQGPDTAQQTLTNYNVGSFDGGGDITLGQAQHAVTLTTTGLDLSRSALIVSEFTDPNTQGNFIIKGNTSLREGSTLRVEESGGLGGQIENDGTMTIDLSQVQVGQLTGTGTVHIPQGGGITLTGASAGETFDLAAGSIEVSGTALGTSNAMQFLAPITDFGATSQLKLDDTQATALEYGGSSPSAGLWLLYDNTTLVASLHIQTASGTLQASYDPTTRAVTFATHDIGSGQILPILPHTA